MRSSVAERVRIHRKRHRNGLRFVRVLLHENEIDSLVHEGYLKQERRRLPHAVQDAVNTFICDRLGPPLREI
jgi:hypothetical protein